MPGRIGLRPIAGPVGISKIGKEIHKRTTGNHTKVPIEIIYGIYNDEYVLLAEVLYEA